MTHLLWSAYFFIVLTNLHVKQLYLLSTFVYHAEEIEKQKAHERYMKLQEQGKTEQAKKDLGNKS
jgi:hypothetical protein